ncbi:hypothetical protein OIU74_022356 [Salix koriyanagi]|uniref:Uncharacterized protein n=1 Tax=Salix koriyanagi TaxID=2511006 RepID=A0A9Q0WKY4_9ROSI|nr:hypothetical protein OIU74_022356 [Salix koriyanagi]
MNLHSPCFKKLEAFLSEEIIINRGIHGRTIYCEIIKLYVSTLAQQKPPADSKQTGINA